MRRPTKRLELWATRRFARVMLAIGRLLPDAAILRFGDATGRLLFAAMPAWRNVARENLGRAFGDERSEAEIEALLRGNFSHYGRILAEFLVMRRWSGAELERRVSIEGLETLDAALTLGRGVIGLTAHYGNWELLAARIVQAGYPLNVIARDADDPATNDLINQVRGDCGYRVVSRKDAARPSLQCLRRNELLGILLDQNAFSGGIYVPFFGHPASTATGPAVLARRTGAPILPCFARREPDGTHVVRIQPPVSFEWTEDPEADIQALTARLTAVIEDAIRAEPTQWLWIHRRWKKQPKQPSAVSHPLPAEQVRLVDG